MPDSVNLEAGVESTYYSSPGRLGLIQQLIHLAQFGDGLSVVQGAAGAGKTSLANQLVVALKEIVGSLQNVLFVSITFDEQLHDTLASVSRSIGLPGGDQKDISIGELLSEIRHYAQGLITDKKLAVLVFDDAHNLSSEALGALLSLLQGESLSGYGLHLVFFSKPGLAHDIDEMQLVELSAYDFDVPLFSPSELAQFLSSVCPAIEGEVPADQVQNLWSQSKGNPGIALRLYQDSMDEQGKKKNTLAMSRRNIPIGHGLALLLLVSILVWAVVVDNDTKDSEGDKVELVQAINNKKIESKVELRPPIVGFIEKESSQVEALSEQEQLAVNAPSLESNEISESVEQSYSVQPDSEQTSFNSSHDSGAEKIEPQKAIDIEPLVDSKVLADSKVLDDLKPVISDFEVKGDVELDTDYSMSADAVLLMEQPETYYTLQVLAASKKESLQNYIDRQANKADLYLYRSLREGRRLYVVVAGVYPSKEMALEARKTLPPEQRKAGPWPRILKGVQQEIAASRVN